MSDDVKVYKNKNRGSLEVRKTYVPQYKVIGVEPTEVTNSANFKPSNNINISESHSQPNDNPRTRRVGIRQPYAAPSTSPIGVSRGAVPNVGNNMEHMWSSIDGEIVDDLNIDSDHPLIDNNDYVSNEAFGVFNEKNESTLSKKVTVESVPDDTISLIYNLPEGDYLLFASGVAVCMGPVKEIQEQARLLVFGDHKLCDGTPIPAEDIVVIKRAPIKIGLFLD